MIYIYEILTEKEKSYLGSLGYYMDFRYDFKKQMYYWTTFCAGFKNIDGIKKEIRRIRLYNLDDARQGFIVDDFEEARKLSMYLSNDMDKESSKILQKEYPDIETYLYAKANYCRIDVLFIPVVQFIEYFKDRNRSMLDLIDLESLYRF